MRLLCVQFELPCTIIVCTESRGLTEISERWIFVIVCAYGSHFDMIHSKRGINRLLHSTIQDRRFPIFFPGGVGVGFVDSYCFVVPRQLNWFPLSFEARGP